MKQTRTIYTENEHRVSPVNKGHDDQVIMLDSREEPVRREGRAALLADLLKL